MRGKASVIILISDEAGKDFLRRHEGERHSLKGWTDLLEASPSRKTGELTYNVHHFGTEREAAAFAVGVCLAGTGYTEDGGTDERYTFRCIPDNRIINGKHSQPL